MTMFPPPNGPTPAEHFLADALDAEREGESQEVVDHLLDLAAVHEAVALEATVQRTARGGLLWSWTRP